MATLIETYEQQYSVVTADIISKICQVKVGPKENRDQLSKEIEALFEEAVDLLEQLELEAHVKGEGPRVAAYRVELQRSRDEFRNLLLPSIYTGDPEESYTDWGGIADQRRLLLDNTERLQRSGRTLTDGYRVALETEQVGAAVLQDLSLQRETIQRSRGRLRETDEQMNRSSRLMNSMLMRALQERFILVVFFIILGIIMCVGLYFFIT